MKILGFIIVVVCVFAGYTLAGGKMEPILKALPFEIMIIGGAAVGAFIVGNTMHVIKDTMKGMKCLVKPEAHDKESYMEW